MPWKDLSLEPSDWGMGWAQANWRETLESSPWGSWISLVGAPRVRMGSSVRAACTQDTVQDFPSSPHAGLLGIKESCFLFSGTHPTVQTATPWPSRSPLPTL